MKSVLIISHAAGTPEIGPNMRTFYLGRKLVSKGYGVNIVGSGVFHKYLKSPLSNVNINEQEVIDGINYSWLSTKQYSKRGLQQVVNQLSFVYRLWKVRKRFIGLKPDYVIFSSPPPLAIYVVNLIVKKSNSKLIFEIRDLWPEIIKELGGFRNNNPYIMLVERSIRIAYSKADAIVSVKPGDLNYIKNTYKPKSLLAYIPNGFDHTGVLDDHFEHQLLHYKSFKLVYTGALSSYYAIGSLLEAVKILKSRLMNLEILIAGDGEDREKYLAYKQEHSLDNVHFLGFLSKKYMLSLIKQCDVAFLGLKDTKANRLGISTNKLYEYMYAKSPVIASYRTDYDVIKESGAGISVPPESPQAIADAIFQFYEMNLDDRIKMGAKGYNYLIKHHTFETISNEYINLFKDLK